MKTYTPDGFKEILRLHKQYLVGDDSGKRADLSGSDLRYSDLSGSDLRGVIGFVYVGQRSDGYQFTAHYKGTGWVICAGCRELSIKSYREHTASYLCDIKRQETLDLLDFAETRIKLLGGIE